MDKFAEAAFNLIILAHQMRDDTSDFGKLCVSELNSIAEKLIEGMGDGGAEWFAKVKTWLQLLSPLFEALKNSKTKDEAIQRLDHIYSAYHDNKMSISVFSKAIDMIGVGEMLPKYKYEISQMAKQTPDSEKKEFLGQIINKI